MSRFFALKAAELSLSLLAVSLIDGVFLEQQ